MVYESDFYTVRRPYSRPTITSYSVTGCRPCLSMRNVIAPPGTHSKVRMSVLLGELNRIQNRHRPHFAYVPTEDFLCSRPLVHFDDEAKHIRAAADKLIRYVHTSVPHETSRLPVRFITAYDRYAPEGRYTSKYSPDIPTNIQCMSFYTEPSRVTIGRGHLACVSYAGGRGYPRRKHLYSDENRDIGDEIKFRSYYSRNVHPNRNDDALLLPTGFASRILLPDRRLLPYDERRPVVFQSKLTKPVGTGVINKEKTEKKPKKKTRAQEIEDAVLAESVPFSYVPPSKYEEPEERTDKYVAETEPIIETSVQPSHDELAHEEPETPEPYHTEEEVNPEPEIPKEPTPPIVETKSRKGSKKTSIKKIEPEDLPCSAVEPEIIESVALPETQEAVETPEQDVASTPVWDPETTGAAELETEEVKNTENLATTEPQESITEDVQDNLVEAVESPIVEDSLEACDAMPEESETKQEDLQTELASESINENDVEKNEEEHSPEEIEKEELPTSEAPSHVDIEEDNVLSNSQHVESEEVEDPEGTLQNDETVQLSEEVLADSVPEIEKPDDDDDAALTQETPAVEAESAELPSEAIESEPAENQVESDQPIDDLILKTEDNVEYQENEISHETKIITETTTESDFWGETIETTTHNVQVNNVTESLSAESITSQMNEPIVEEPVTPSDE